MIHEITARLVGTSSQYFILRIWTDGDKSKDPIVHSSKTKGYLNNLLKRYKG